MPLQPSLGAHKNRRTSVIEREPFRALAARDGKTATGRWVLELGVVQHAGDECELAVDRDLAQLREQQPEQVGAERVLEHMRSQHLASLEGRLTRELGVGPIERVEVEAGAGAPTGREPQPR